MSILIKSLRVAALATAFGAASIALLPASAQAAEEVNIMNGAAVHGYDVVGYFTDGKPMQGKEEFSAEYMGATYRFANAEHLDLFKADPAKYVPQYGGYCAFGTAMGRKFDGDPTAWKIVDGKLYLNLSQDVQKRWVGNIPGFIRGADNNWGIIKTLADTDLEKAAPAGVTIGAQ